ncbi:hypothetical protein G6F60_014687 [Rhizopus arrhizus]|nr:hypothetical protein G6F60_014687 [Rhizopus arrhizus]
MRKLSPQPPTAHALPVDDESRLALLKVFKDEPTTDAPLLSGDVEDSLGQLLAERRQSERLQAMGRTPTRSAIFVGPPGVGKTLTARWLAAQLKVPLQERHQSAGGHRFRQTRALRAAAGRNRRYRQATQR